MPNTLPTNHFQNNSSEIHDLFQTTNLEQLLNSGLYETSLKHGRPASDVFADLEKRFGFTADV